ncbi:hypothetical protein BKA70DRAFT_1423271 [Coprinopsis sp. MPI-PUGE-AT-0042]|nr:hypothetical protein BKA70DRAFT_1423271 [Coprinopsis sp. MPI-PUGE-AT-0042]
MKFAILFALTLFVTSQCLAASLQTLQAIPNPGGFPIHHTITKCVDFQGPLANSAPVISNDCNAAAGQFKPWNITFSSLYF